MSVLVSDSKFGYILILENDIGLFNFLDTNPFLLSGYYEKEEREEITFYFYDENVVFNDEKHFDAIPLNDILKNKMNLYQNNDNFGVYFSKKNRKIKDSIYFSFEDVMKIILKGVNKKHNAFIIDSVDDFIKVLKKVGLSGDHYYRGIADCTFELIPSLFRNKYLVKNEDILYHEFKNSFINELHDKIIIENLTTMQHYGLPTRLLDVTTNPLVALYMSVNNVFNGKEYEKSIGEVIIFDDVNNRDVKYFDNNTVLVLSSLALLTDNEKIYLKNNINKLTKEDSVIDKLESIVKLDNPAFTMNYDNYNFLEIPIFLKPSMLNRRVDAQSGAFILFGLSENYIENKYRNNVRLFIFDKEKIRSELALLGFSNKTMIPDMDYVAKYLKEKYSKR